MAYYQKLERPVANESEAVQLKFGLTLQQIMDVVSYLSPPEIIQFQQVLSSFIFYKGSYKQILFV